MDYFGIREVCNVTLRSLRNIPACRSMTGKEIKKGEPVMYFDFLKVSNISGSVATVYATGGRGNTRRLSWDGDREITFHIEDALISPMSMAILTAAQLIRRKIVRTAIDPSEFVLDRNLINIPYIPGSFYIELANVTGFDPETFVNWAVIEVMYDEIAHNDVTGEDEPTGNTIGPVRILSKNIEYDRLSKRISIAQDDKGSHAIKGIVSEITRFEILSAIAGKNVYKHEKYTVNAMHGSADGMGRIQLPAGHEIIRDSMHPLFIFDRQPDGSIDLLSDISGSSNDIKLTGKNVLEHPDIYEGNDYIVDYYRKIKGNTTSLVITADGTSDYYKLEGETLMRRETDAQDVPVAITMPKVKPRAQFEIPMSATGDPATFAFDFDVFPANDPNYDKCGANVMVIMDIIEDDEDDCNCVYNSLLEDGDEE